MHGQVAVAGEVCMQGGGGWGWGIQGEPTIQVQMMSWENFGHKVVVQGRYTTALVQQVRTKSK